jgi:hypothetical protein
MKQQIYEKIEIMIIWLCLYNSTSIQCNGKNQQENTQGHASNATNDSQHTTDIIKNVIHVIH